MRCVYIKIDKENAPCKGSVSELKFVMVPRSGGSPLFSLASKRILYLNQQPHEIWCILL